MCPPPDHSNRPLARSRVPIQLLDVNAPDVIKRTPLDHAASEGHKEIVELLIAEGVDVNMKVMNGTTPLLWAAFFGHKAIAELLIDKGADVIGRFSATSGLSPVKYSSRLFRWSWSGSAAGLHPHLPRPVKLQEIRAGKGNS